MSQQLQCPKCHASIVQDQPYCDNCKTKITWLTPQARAAALQTRRRAVASVIVLVLCFVFFKGCFSSPSSQPSSVKLVAAVPEKVEANIRAEIKKAEQYFSVREVYMLDSGAVSVFLDFKFDPESQDEVSKWVCGFIDSIEKLHNYELDIQIQAMQHIEGTDKDRVYGFGSFRKASGRIEYKPLK